MDGNIVLNTSVFSICSNSYNYSLKFNVNLSSIQNDIRQTDWNSFPSEVFTLFCILCVRLNFKTLIVAIFPISLHWITQMFANVLIKPFYTALLAVIADLSHLCTSSAYLDLGFFMTEALLDWMGCVCGLQFFFLNRNLKINSPKQHVKHGECECVWKLSEATVHLKFKMAQTEPDCHHDIIRAILNSHFHFSLTHSKINAK